MDIFNGFKGIEEDIDRAVQDALPVQATVVRRSSNGKTAWVRFAGEPSSSTPTQVPISQDCPVGTTVWVFRTGGGKGFAVAQGLLSTDELTYAIYDPSRPQYGAIRGAVSGAQRTANSVAIQAAADDAKANDGVLVIKGEYECGASVNVDCHVDGKSGRLLFYDGAINPAVLVGTTVSGAPTHRRNIVLPAVIQMAAKPGAGLWGSGVGVEVANTNACFITIQMVQNFGTNLKLTGYGQGNAYNEYHLGHLDNGKINLHFAPPPGGWVNENNFYGGRFSNYSYEGSNIAGNRHILIDDTGYRPNNNVFIKPSIEGTAPEYHVEMRGSDNTFINPRWETAPPDTPKLLMYGVDAINNTFFHGYDAARLQITWANGALARYNEFFDRSAIRKYGSATEGVIVAANNYSDNVGVFTVLGASADTNTNTSTAYMASIGANKSRYKRNTDDHPRLEIDHQNGSIKFGGGSSATDVVMQRYGGDKVGLGSGDTFYAEVIQIGSRYYWTDSAGKLRSHTSAPSSSNSTAEGVIVGTQT